MLMSDARFSVILRINEIMITFEVFLGVYNTVDMILRKLSEKTVKIISVFAHSNRNEI